jgi:hypothetical protein
LDLWSNLSDNHGYYYFGDSWNVLDFGGSTFNQDQFYISDGVVCIKSGAITDNEVAENAAIAGTKIEQGYFAEKGDLGAYLKREEPDGHGRVWISSDTMYLDAPHLEITGTDTTYKYGTIHVNPGYVQLGATNNDLVQSFVTTTPELIQLRAKSKVKTTDVTVDITGLFVNDEKVLTEGDFNPDDYLKKSTQDNQGDVNVMTDNATISANAMVTLVAHDLNIMSANGDIRIGSLPTPGDNSAIEITTEKISLAAPEIELNGDVVVAEGKKIFGTSESGAQHEIIGLNEYDIDGSTYDQIEVGSESIHLNLNTNNDPNYDNHVTVDTPSGKKVLSYQEDILLCTQAEFDAITTKDPKQIYFVKQ